MVQQKIKQILYKIYNVPVSENKRIFLAIGFKGYAAMQPIVDEYN